MESITMIPTTIDAALASVTDGFGGAAGVFIAAHRDRGPQPKTALVSDPRPAGPPV